MPSFLYFYDSILIGQKLVENAKIEKFKHCAMTYLNFHAKNVGTAYVFGPMLILARKFGNIQFEIRF